MQFNVRRLHYSGFPSRSPDAGVHLQKAQERRGDLKRRKLWSGENSGGLDHLKSRRVAPLRPD